MRDSRQRREWARARRAGVRRGGVFWALGLAITAGYARTGLDGKFTIRVTRMFPAPSDSATLWIRATKIPLPSDAVTIRDSVRVRLRVAGIGEIPDTTYIDFVLPIP